MIIPKGETGGLWHCFNQGLVNVPIEHHPTIGDIISNKYLKVMFKIAKKGHLLTPVEPHYSNPFVQVAGRVVKLLPSISSETNLLRPFNASACPRN